MAHMTDEHRLKPTLVISTQLTYRQLTDKVICLAVKEACLEQLYLLKIVSLCYHSSHHSQDAPQESLQSLQLNLRIASQFLLEESTIFSIAGLFLAPCS